MITFTREDGDIMVLVDEVPAPHDVDQIEHHDEGEEHSNDTEFDSAQGISQFALNGEFFYLKTLFRGDDECLEGNKFSEQSTLGGAAFMSDCGASGQHFRLVPSARDGYFHLKTRFRGEDECLEVNQFSDQATLGGAAFMSSCTGQSGMLWKLVPISGG